MRLNTSRSYGTICGTVNGFPGAAYEQDGQIFDIHGNICGPDPLEKPLSAAMALLPADSTLIPEQTVVVVVDQVTGPPTGPTGDDAGTGPAVVLPDPKPATRGPLPALYAMSVSELTKFAATEKIDITGKKSQAAIIKAIKAAWAVPLPPADAPAEPQAE